MPFTVGSMGKVALVDLYNEKKNTGEERGDIRHKQVLSEEQY